MRAAGDIDNISVANIQAVMFMFDVTNQDSYEGLPIWYDTLMNID